MPTDWINELVNETGAHASCLRNIINSVLEAEAAQENSSSDYWIGRNVGFQYGVFDTLRHMGAHSDTVVEAIRQVRKEREHEAK